MSIGALAIDPGRPQTVYAGTGDPNVACCFVGAGLGVFRSIDGGSTWTNVNSAQALRARPSYDLGGPFTLRTWGGDVSLRRVVGPGTVAEVGWRVRNRTFSLARPDAPDGRISGYTLGLDHDFRDVKATLAYVATTGIHLPCVFSPNSYSGADPAFAPFTIFDSTGKSRIGGYGNESVMTSSSHSSYHSLQASLSKNSPRAGIGLQASYTYSKSLDDTSSVLGGLFGTAGVILQTLPQDPWNPRAEKGPSTFDVAHVVTLSWIQLLPLNRVSFLRSLPRPLTTGWQFLNITTLTTGSPFTVYSGVQQTGAGAGGTDRPDLVKMPRFSTRRAVRADYFGLGAENASFFSIPINLPGGTGPNQGRFGTLGRNTFRGPAFHDFDFALVKDTSFGHRSNGELGTLEFRAEFFNVFNLVNFGLPSNIVRGSGFGIISKTAGSSRQVQFSVEIIF